MQITDVPYLGQNAHKSGQNRDIVLKFGTTKGPESWMRFNRFIMLNLFPLPSASAVCLGSLTLPRRPAASDVKLGSAAPSLATCASCASTRTRVTVKGRMPGERPGSKLTRCLNWTGMSQLLIFLGKDLARLKFGIMCCLPSSLPPPWRPSAGPTTCP